MDDARKLVAGLVATFLGIAFIAIYLPLVIATFQATQAPIVNDGFAAFAVGVAGYVGGVIAAWFGIKDPDGDPFRILGSRLLPKVSVSVATVVAMLFVLAYFGISLACIYLWGTKPDVIPILLTAQATASVGLAFAVVTKLAAS